MSLHARSIAGIAGLILAATACGQDVPGVDIVGISGDSEGNCSTTPYNARQAVFGDFSTGMTDYEKFPSSILDFADPSVRGSVDGCPPFCFEHRETPSNHQGLWNLSVGDLDGDSDLDVAAVGILIEGVFSVYKNRGDGSFETPALYTIGYDPRCILLKDMDGDGDLDLIVSNSLGGKLFVYSNPGNGVFGDPSATYEFPDGVRPIDFVAADLDDDGDLDLAVSDSYGTLALLWNRGDGKFKFGPSYKINGYGFLYEIIAHDLSGDGFLDLAVLTIPYIPPNVYDDKAAVVTLTNDGRGRFGSMQSYHVPSWPTLALAAADLDSDGDLDLAGVNSPNARPKPNGLWVILNDGAGRFDQPSVHAVGPWPHDVNFADFDGDGDLDAVVPNQRFANAPPPHDVSILLNRGDGTFEDECREIVGYKPSAAIPADLDGNGTLDVAISNFAGYGYASSISVLLNRCEP